LSSGGTIYGLGRNGIFKETDACEPITYYGQSKKIIEEYIMFANRKYCLEYLILRPSNPYGRYQSLRGEQGFISVALGKVINSEPIELWGDGSIIRDYIYIDDFLKIFSFLLKNNLFNRIINVGSGSGHTLIDVINIIKDVTGKSAIINIMPSRNVDVPRMILDIGLLSEIFTFKFTSLETGICEYYNTISDNDAQ
jgi:UDP-glucose 4-epimerase